MKPKKISMINGTIKITFETLLPNWIHQLLTYFITLGNSFLKIKPYERHPRVGINTFVFIIQHIVSNAKSNTATSITSAQK
ncbi:hypothetical protein [Tamlana flava]|uniref:hypothetical protein n=1 Tax=Tamlana flava TaxID=3158572 RepID=UPI00351AEB46